MEKTQVAVIGAGPGGYVAAFRAADLGLQVTLIDPEADPGGVCLYRGCIPSKALLHVARLISEAREAEAWGVRFAKPKVDLDRLNAWKDGVIARLTGGLGQLVKARRIRYLRGRAKLSGAHEAVVTLAEGGQTELQFGHAILATGSRPATVPLFPTGDPRVLDSSGALALAQVPRSLLVVGGGYIGLELGSVYAALGSRVSVVEMTDALIAPADRDLVKPLQARLGELFAEVRLSTQVVAVRPEAKGLEVDFRGPDGATSTQTYACVLVSVGRRPNSEGLGLEHTRVECDARGFVVVDNQRRTAEPSLFAIGDVIGSGLAHTASHEGMVAAEAIAGHHAVFEPQAVPAVVFTDPELAWCGLTEQEARRQGRTVKVSRFPWAASGRATTLARSEGLTKLVIEPGTDRVLGVGVVGPGAGELIAEGVLAIEMGAVARDLSLCIHPHPTLSETVMEAAEVYFGQSPHLFAPRRP